MDVKEDKPAGKVESDHAPVPPIRRPGKAARVDNDTLLAELEKMPAPKPPAKAAAPAEDPPAPTIDDEPLEEISEATEEGSDADPEAEESATEDEPAAEEEVKLDPAAERATREAQKRERQWRETMAKDRAAFEAERQAFVAEWRPKIEAVQRFEQAKARARYAPDLLLEEMGLTEEDFEAAAHILMARSPAGQKDPARRAYADRLKREREGTDKVSATEKRLAELEKKLADKEREADYRSREDAYLDGALKAAGKGQGLDPDTGKASAAPLLKARLAKAPAKMRTRMLTVANQLAAQHGEVPDVREVIHVVEGQLREELEELGIDPATLGGAPAPAAEASARGPARTLGRAGGAPTAPKAKPKTRDDMFDDLRRELESNRLDS